MTRKEYLQKIAIEYIKDITNNIVKINEAIMNGDFSKVIVLCIEGFSLGTLYQIKLANAPDDRIENGTLVKINFKEHK